MKKLLEIKEHATGEYHAIVTHKYNVNYEKLWGAQERNMVGSIRGTLIGVATNIEATTDYMDSDEIQLLTKLLNQPYFTARYYDTESKETKEADFTGSDISTELVRLYDKEYKSVTITLTGVDII